MKKNQEEKEKEIIKEACLNGEINTIKKYLFSSDSNNYFDINQLFDYNVNKQGSLLHISCYKGNLEITKLLCTHPNINLNQKNKNGITPFYEAYYCNNHLNIIQFLCEIPEIDINLFDRYGLTPLHYACNYNKIDFVKILLKQENRIEKNKKENDNGNSPLHIACAFGNLEIVQLLCEEKSNKININLTNNEGETAFWIACENGHLEIIKYLFLKYKNNNNFYEKQIPNEGFSPLHISCEYGNFEIVKFLLENNVNEIENIEK